MPALATMFWCLIFWLSSVLRGCPQLYACFGFSRLSVKTSISDLTRVFFSQMWKPLKTLQQKCSMFNVANAPSCCALVFWYFFNRRFDTENSGFIRREDLFKVLESESEALQVMKELDVNNDGKISYEEFIGTSENNEKQQYGYSYIAFRWFNDMGFWWVLLSGRVLLSSFVLVFIIIICLFSLHVCLFLDVEVIWRTAAPPTTRSKRPNVPSLGRSFADIGGDRWRMYIPREIEIHRVIICNHRLFLKYHWF